jgi:Cys-tRNA(Pro)/Cys-tRNA(Cys) deacylase
VHTYQVDSVEGSYGESVAMAIGVEPCRVFKTLVASVDGRHAVAIVPVVSKLSLKALARAAEGKRAHMAEARDAERLTGYVVGGISPFGQTRRLPVYADESTFDHDTIFVSGGRRGIQLEITPALLQSITAATRAPLT